MNIDWKKLWLEFSSMNLDILEYEIDSEAWMEMMNAIQELVEKQIE